jgi:hypothetical protein
VRRFTASDLVKDVRGAMSCGTFERRAGVDDNTMERRLSSFRWETSILKKDEEGAGAH